MSKPLQVGVRAARMITVDRARTIDFMGEGLRVYATPEIIWDVEMLCRDLLIDHLEAGYDSVGVHVELQHISSGLPGTVVEVTASVSCIDGRRVTFEVSVKDAVEVLAHGRHERVTVSLDKTMTRLEAKRRRLDGLPSALEVAPPLSGDVNGTD